MSNHNENFILIRIQTCLHSHFQYIFSYDLFLMVNPVLNCTYSLTNNVVTNSLQWLSYYFWYILYEHMLNHAAPNGMEEN